MLMLKKRWMRSLKVVLKQLIELSPLSDLILRWRSGMRKCPAILEQCHEANDRHSLCDAYTAQKDGDFVSIELMKPVIKAPPITQRDD